MSAEKEATICTVVTPLHRRLIRINYELTMALNPGVKLSWIVVDNRDIHLSAKKIKQVLEHSKRSIAETAKAQERTIEEEKSKYYDPGETSDYLPGARILLGLDPREAHEYFADSYSEGNGKDEAETERLLEKYLASYHHAAGLNLALEKVDTRFGIVVDPDLYVVRPSWIKEVIDHMKANDLAVFGAPWNPRWYMKWRYFPCTHWMVIDFDRVEWRRDLLAPDLVGPGEKFVSPVWIRYPSMRAKGKPWAIAYLLKNGWRALSQDWRQRATIGLSRDTGYRMHREFARRPDLKSDMVMPVFDPRVDGFMPASVFRPQRNAILEALLPDPRRYIPRKPGYFSSTGFKERGYPDCRRLQWEEFLWRDRPFAFHLRGEMQRQPLGLGRVDHAMLLRHLNTILSRHQVAPLADPTP